jgi:hypothetical protein
MKWIVGGLILAVVGAVYSGRVPMVWVVKKYLVFAVHAVSVTVTAPAVFAPETPWRTFVISVPAVPMSAA